MPQMHFYKRGAVWGEAVKRYLRAGGVEETKAGDGEVRRRKA